MSEDMKPKKNRRRQRTRRKRELITVDRMAPGRAPVGLFAAETGEYVPYFVNDRRSAIHGGEQPGDSTLTPSHARVHRTSPPSLLSFNRPCASTQGYPVELSPSLLHSPISSPIPDKPEGLPSCSSPLPPQRSSSSVSHFQGWESSHSILINFPHPQPEVVHRRVSSAPPSRTTPAFVSSHSSVSDMAPQGPSLTSQARAAELNAATAARIRYRSGELNDLSELASSRPISLGELSCRNNSRNKGSKMWKPFPLADLQESCESGAPETNHPPLRRSSDQFPPSFYMDPPPQFGNHHIPTAVTSVQVHSSSERNLRDEENRPLFHEMSIRVQRNPLGHFGVLEDIGNNPMSQRYSVVVPNESKHRDIDRPLAPQDISPSKQEEKFAYRGLQQNNFFPHSMLFMPPTQPYPYFQGYQVAPQMSLMKAPGTSGPFIYPQHYGQLEFHNQQAQFQVAAAGSQDYRHMSETAIASVNDHLNNGHGLSTMAPNPTGTDGKPQSQTLGTSTVQRRVSTPSLTPNDERYTAKKTGSYDAKREMTAFLDRVVEASKSNKANIARNNPSELKEVSSPAEKQLDTSNQQMDTASISVTSSDPFLGEHETYLLGSQSSSSSDISEVSSFPPFEGLRPRPKPQRVIFSSDLPKKTAKNLEGLSLTEIPLHDGNIKRPPPGLAHPSSSEILGSAPFSTSHGSSVTERLREAERWFHADGRGEKDFRNQVLAIAQAEALRRKVLYRIESDSLFEPKTLLVGNVIANLRSYVVGDRKEQFGNFANFEAVPYHCCETSHGGLRSYFDSDPYLGQWRLPTGRPFHNFTFRTAERLAVRPYARPQMYFQ